MKAALRSDKPVRGRWPPACVRFVTVLPRHTAPTHPQMGDRNDRVTDAAVCVTAERRSKKADKSSTDQAELYDSDCASLSSIIWKHVLAIHRQEPTIMYFIQKMTSLQLVIEFKAVVIATEDQYSVNS